MGRAIVLGYLDGGDLEKIPNTDEPGERVHVCRRRRHAHVCALAPVSKVTTCDLRGVPSWILMKYCVSFLLITGTSSTVTLPDSTCPPVTCAFVTIQANMRAHIGVRMAIDVSAPEGPAEGTEPFL